MTWTGVRGLYVAGLAATGGGGGPSTAPTRAALFALDDSGFPASAVTAVVHVGPRAARPVSGAVRDVIGAVGCLHAFDVDADAAGVVTALAVGGSLLGGDGVVLITVCEQDGDSASLVLAGGPTQAATVEFDEVRTDGHRPYVLRAASPIRGLLDCRASGRYDVVLVAEDVTAPTASVRCRLQHPL